MECSRCGGSMLLNGRVLEISSGAWKTGLSRSHLGKVFTTTDASRRVRLVKRSTPACERASESVTAKAFAGDKGSGFHAGAVRWVGPGTSFQAQTRPSTAVEAGRSKAKKEKRRLAQLTFRRPRESSQGNTPGGPSRGEDENVANEGVKSAEVSSESSSPEVPARSPEDHEVALNLTWQEAGLGDRREAGRFRREKAPGVAQTIRVGGWGKDKSMQRVITPEQQREAMIRARNKEQEQKLKAETRPKKKKLYAGFDDDPTVEHPPEYYKYGPFGPYAWKPIPVGEHLRGEWDTNQVVVFTDVKDVADSEDRVRANVSADYLNTVAKFNQNVGIQYFYAFARRKYRPRSDPWKEWSVVAQIAIESGDDHSDQAQLFLGMGSKMQDLTTTLVAWARPDLIYVRKPHYDLRLEPQEPFIKGLMELLNPTEEKTSFYTTLCRLLNVKLEASPLQVRAAYDALPKDGQLECLKHVFSNHPVKLIENPSPDSAHVEGVDQPPERQERDDGDGEAWRAQTDWDPWNPREIKMLGVKTPEQTADKASSERKRRKIPPKKRMKIPAKFRSAVAPFTYSNFVEEIALLWEYKTYGKVSMDDVPSSEFN